MANDRIEALRGESQRALQAREAYKTELPNAVALVSTRLSEAERRMTVDSEARKLAKDSPAYMEALEYFCGEVGHDAAVHIAAKINADIAAAEQCLRENETEIARLHAVEAAEIARAETVQPAPAKPSAEKADTVPPAVQHLLEASTGAIEDQHVETLKLLGQAQAELRNLQSAPDSGGEGPRAAISSLNGRISELQRDANAMLSLLESREHPKAGGKPAAGSKKKVVDCYTYRGADLSKLSLAELKEILPLFSVGAEKVRPEARRLDALLCDAEDQVEKQVLDGANRAEATQRFGLNALERQLNYVSWPIRTETFLKRRISYLERTAVIKGSTGAKKTFIEPPVEVKPAAVGGGKPTPKTSPAASLSGSGGSGGGEAPVETEVPRLAIEPSHAAPNRHGVPVVKKRKPAGRGEIVGRSMADLGKIYGVPDSEAPAEVPHVPLLVDEPGAEDEALEDLMAGITNGVEIDPTRH